MKNIYIFAKFSKLDCIGIRIGGPGLGNILFPWARSRIAAQKYNIPIINSTWSSIKLGPLLRGELDKRGYSDLFIEKNISGLKKFFLLIFSKKIKEDDLLKEIDKKSIFPRIIIFKDMKNQMDDIVGHHKFIKKELIKITQKKHLDKIEKFDGTGITVHIRLGDFYIPPSEEEIKKGATNCRLPLQWYITVINKIRNNISKDLPVNIFSDAKDEEISEILSLSNTKRYYFGSAIADLLAISKSDILIASNSTFSLWASYLGQMPTVWFPGTHRFSVLSNSHLEFELDYDEQMPSDFIHYLKEFLMQKL